jgi:speckle-type POZ protein
LSSLAVNKMAQQKIGNAASSTQVETSAISLASTSFWCQTKATVEEFDFEWTIERLAFFDDGGTWEALTSAEFFNNYQLSINLEGHSNGDSNVKIMLLIPFVTTSSVKVELAISNEKCKKIFQNTTSIPKNTNRSYVTVFKVSKTTLLESGDFVNGNITIYCKFRFLKRNVLKGKATATETPIKTNRQYHILNQLVELFGKMLLSDVTFNVRGQKCEAHKNILAMRSPVFAAMFQHPTKEMLSGNVEVEDVDPDVFQEVLRYLYTGSPQSTAMDVMAPALLAAADKYLLEELKIHCETHLIRQMSTKNCIDLLSLTTHHPAGHLKKFAIEYFRRYPSKFTLKSFDKKKYSQNNRLSDCLSR